MPLVEIKTVARKFSIGGLCSSAGGLLVCVGGIDIIKLTKTPLIYSVSPFSLGGLGALFGGLSLPKPPRGNGTGRDPYWLRYLIFDFTKQYACFKPTLMFQI